MLRIVTLVVAAGLAGGGVGYVASTAGDDAPATTTVVRTIENTPAAAPAADRSPGLSAGEIYRRDAPGVVVVTAVTETQDPFSGTQQASSLGSGFVLNRDGYILTNAHVVLDATAVEVGFSSGDTYPAEVVGVDESTDVGVLKVDVPADALTPLELGSADDVAVGDPVVAIGNPLGTERTITSGIISAVAREIDSLVPGIKIYGALQTDAAINHGNSGGPLIDRNARVIGINSQILSENNGNVGIGFAIPIDTAKRVAEQIIDTGHAQHTFLGIEGTELVPEIAKAVDIPVDHGVLVADVTPDSPAEKAGVRGGDETRTVEGQTITLGGDVITAIDGERMESFSDLAGTVASHRPVDRVTLDVVRDGETLQIDVTLAAREG
jgi:S1-C subfamily serine protease